MKNYFEKLQLCVDKYKIKYAGRPRKAAMKLAWWSFACCFRKYEHFEKNQYTECNQRKNMKWYQQKNDSNKELLIVNTDSIGDYILCRNFFSEIKKCKKYKKYKITLLGCEKFKSFAEYLDSDVIDKFLWVPERPEFLGKKLFKICDNLHNSQGLKHYYDTIVFPSYNSLSKLDAHNILTSKISYREKILRASCPQRIKDTNSLSDFTYVYMDYKAEQQAKFEFDLNKSFYEDLLDEKISLNFPYIENTKVQFDSTYLNNKQKEYVVINPCAYNKYRMWHPHNYQEVISYIKQLNYDVVIVCGNGEADYCRELCSSLGFDDIDVLVNKPISELLSILKLAKMYVGPDSGIFHVAAALDIKALCLSSGMAFFRFMNYPKFKKNIKVLFPNGTEDWISENIENEKVGNVDNYSINMLSMKEVKKNINYLLTI